MRTHHTPLIGLALFALMAFLPTIASGRDIRDPVPTACHLSPAEMPSMELASAFDERLMVVAYLRDTFAVPGYNWRTPLAPSNRTARLHLLAPRTVLHGLGTHRRARDAI